MIGTPLFKQWLEVMEKRIAILESKSSQCHPDRTTIDFEGSGATRVPTGENEINTERLKGENDV